MGAHHLHSILTNTTMKGFFLLLVSASSLAAPNYPKEAPSSPGISYEPVQHKKEHPHMPYNYAWAVADPGAGLDFGQNENSDGNVVSGEYRVLLPDGRTQIVRYTSDHVAGYVAEVTYEGEAKPYVAPPKPAYPAL